MQISSSLVYLSDTCDGIGMAIHQSSVRDQSTLKKTEQGLFFLNLLLLIFVGGFLFVCFLPLRGKSNNKSVIGT